MVESIAHGIFVSGAWLLTLNSFFGVANEIKKGFLSSLFRVQKDDWVVHGHLRLCDNRIRYLVELIAHGIFISRACVLILNSFFGAANEIEERLLSSIFGVANEIKKGICIRYLK